MLDPIKFGDLEIRGAKALLLWIPQGNIGGSGRALRGLLTRSRLHDEYNLP